MKARIEVRVIKQDQNGFTCTAMQTLDAQTMELHDTDTKRSILLMAYKEADMMVDAELEKRRKAGPAGKLP